MGQMHRDAGLDSDNATMLAQSFQVHNVKLANLPE